MLRENKVHTDLDFTEGLYAFAYPYLQEVETKNKLLRPFVESITEHVVNKEFSPYYLVNQALYTGFFWVFKIRPDGEAEGYVGRYA